MVLGSTGDGFRKSYFIEFRHPKDLLIRSLRGEMLTGFLPVSFELVSIFKFCLVRSQAEGNLDCLNQMQIRFVIGRQRTTHSPAWLCYIARRSRAPLPNAVFWGLNSKPTHILL